MRYLLVASLVAGAALTGCGGGSKAAGQGDSGVQGIVLIGPSCPVERLDSPCPDQPLAAQIRIVATRSGTVVTTVRSGDDGRFRVALAPGDYRLEPVSPNPSGMPFGQPAHVTVRAHAFVSVTVTFDSGVR